MSSATAMAKRLKARVEHNNHYCLLLPIQYHVTYLNLYPYLT